MTEARRDVVIDIEGSSVDFVTAAAAAELAMERLNRQYAAANSLLQRSNLLHQNFQRNQERLNRIVPQRSDPAQHITESYNSANESIESVRTALQGGFDTNRIKAIRLFEESPEQIRQILNATQNLQPPPRQDADVDTDTNTLDTLKDKYVELADCIDIVGDTIAGVKQEQESFATPNLTAAKTEYQALDTLIADLNTKLDTLQNRQVNIQVDRPQTTEPITPRPTDEPGPQDSDAPFISEEQQNSADALAETFSDIQENQDNIMPAELVSASAVERLKQTNRLTDAQTQKLRLLDKEEEGINDKIENRLNLYTEVSKSLNTVEERRRRDQGNETALQDSLNEYDRLNAKAEELTKNIETSKNKYDETNDSLSSQQEILKGITTEQINFDNRPLARGLSPEISDASRAIADSSSKIAVIRKELRAIRFDAQSLARFDFANLDERTFFRVDADVERDREKAERGIGNIRDGEHEIFNERVASLVVIKEQRVELAK